MTIVNIYLTFNGNCEAAFNFYKSIFGGDFPYMGRFSEMPTQEGSPPIPDADKEKIMHISLPISKETVLMGSDTAGEAATNFKQGTNFSISINTDKKEEADRLFTALSAGGETTLAMNKTFWGSYYGMLTDKFGIQWMLNVDLNRQ